MLIIFLLSLPLIGFSMGTMAGKDILISYVATSLFIFYFFLRKGNSKIYLPKEMKFLWYFLIYIILTVLYRASVGLLTTKNIGGLTMTAIFFLFYFILTNIFILMDKKRLRNLVGWFILISAVYSLFTCLQAVMPANSFVFNLFRNSNSSFTTWDASLPSSHDSWGSLNRVTGFAPEPGMWAAFLAVPISLLLPRLFYKFRLQDLFCFFSIFLGFLLTYGRTGWMGLVLAIVAFPSLLLSGKKRNFYLIFVLIAVCLTLYLSIFSKMDIKEGVDWSTYERAAGMIKATRMFVSSPIFGVGIGEFRAREPEFDFENLSRAGGGGAFPYNMYLALAAETGIIGLALWLLFVKGIWDKAYSNLSEIKDNLDDKILLMGLDLAFLTILFGWINIGSFNLMYIFFIFALISTLSYLENENKSCQKL